MNLEEDYSSKDIQVLGIMSLAIQFPLSISRHEQENGNFSTLAHCMKSYV